MYLCISVSIICLPVCLPVSLSIHSFIPPSLHPSIHPVVSVHSGVGMLPGVSDCSGADHFPLRGWVPPDGATLSPFYEPRVWQGLCGLCHGRRCWRAPLPRALASLSCTREGPSGIPGRQIEPALKRNTLGLMVSSPLMESARANGSLTQRHWQRFCT